MLSRRAWLGIKGVALGLGATVALGLPARVPEPTKVDIQLLSFRPTDSEPERLESRAPWTTGAPTYLAQSWNLAAGYASTVVRAVDQSAKRYQLDPMLLLAVAATESSFKHDIGNPDGGADPMKPFGIMQVAGRWHRDKFPHGVVVPTTVEQNIHLGARVLREYLDREGGDMRRALLRYGGSPDTDEYYRKVQQRRLRFSQALQTSRV